MINKLTKSVCIILAVLLFGCEAKNEAEENLIAEPVGKVGKLVLSFDDRSIKQWHSALNIFDMYEAKATFFITGYYKTSDYDKALLKEIQEAGHEIGSHSVNHLNAIDYISQHGIDKYITDEINPNIKAMTDNGFNIESFAFPYNATNSEIQEALSPYFTSMRAGTRTINNAITDGNNELLLALSIDNLNREGLVSIMKAMDLAHEKGDYILFYAHKIPLGDSCEDQALCIEQEILMEVLNYAQSLGMEFATHKEITKSRLTEE